MTVDPQRRIDMADAKHARELIEALYQHKGTVDSYLAVHPEMANRFSDLVAAGDPVGMLDFWADLVARLKLREPEA